MPTRPPSRAIRSARSKTYAYRLPHGRALVSQHAVAQLLGGVLDVRRVAQYDIETALRHNPKECGQPVEGPMSFLPRLEAGRFVHVNAVLRCKETVQVQLQ